MEVDSSSTLALASFLALVVGYPTSPAPLRLAIRRYLPEPENIVAVLDVLDGWLAKTFTSERPLFASEDKANTTVDDLPPVEKVRRVFSGPETILTFCLTLDHRICSDNPRCILPGATAVSSRARSATASIFPARTRDGVVGRAHAALRATRGICQGRCGA